MYQFDGLILDEILVENVVAQAKMRRDKRCRLKCPQCGGKTTPHREGMLTVYDLPLADRTAYLLKEEFRMIDTLATSPHSAKLRIRSWCKSVRASGIHALEKFAKGIERDLNEVTAFFQSRLTSGLIESFNNQIARLVHRSCEMPCISHLFLKMRAQSLQHC